MADRAGEIPGGGPVTKGEEVTWQVLLATPTSPVARSPFVVADGSHPDFVGVDLVHDTMLEVFERGDAFAEFVGREQEGVILRAAWFGASVEA